VAEAEILVLRQDMTITRDAFLRSLPAAVDHVPFGSGDGGIRSLDPGRPWRIALTELPALEIGLIRLARQRVEIYLTGYDEAGTKRFLERFELYFRRGGG
jgi:hypothetical protein